MKLELELTTNVLLREINEMRLTRDQVTATYALAMCSSETTDWAKVNHAIIQRWSHSALHYIKHKAWKIAELKEDAP